MFLLDTNALSASRRRDKVPRLSAWIASTPPADVYIAAVTILEIEYGALRVARRDSRQGLMLSRWIRNQVLVSFAGRIIAFDEAIAMRCATLHVPNRRPERDAMIAATALEHRLTVVTRNVQDFAPMGVPILNPWSE